MLNENLRKGKFEHRIESIDIDENMIHRMSFRLEPIKRRRMAEYMQSGFVTVAK